MGFIQAAGDHFELDGHKILLRGWALGSWMNFEHFMIGLPGTNSQIIDAFRSVYGDEHTEEFLDSILTNMVDEADIRYLKSIGVNSVRIPFGYHYLMDDKNPYVLIEKGFERLNRAVELCSRNGLYVILDLHSTPGSQNTDWHSDNITGQPLFWRYRVFQDQVLWLWEQLASRYADNPWVVGYDVINEPGFDLDAETINGFYKRALQTIRRVDSKHILFLEGTDFGRDFTQLQKLDDPNIAYTVHFYPFVLEDNILDASMDDARRMEIFTKIFDRQLSAVARLERPVWCGESGYEIQDGQEDFYSLLLKHNIQLCENRGISWNLWTYKDARCMGIVIPQKDSAWMQLAEDIAAEWSHHREEKISMEITKELGTRYYKPLSEHQAYVLDFQIRSTLHEVAVEQVLKPRLRAIPWEEMRRYPDDFAFAACAKRETVVRDIQYYIQHKEEN